MKKLYGHSQEIEELQKLYFSDKLPPTLLIYGNSGVGKSILAHHLTHLIISNSWEIDTESQIYKNIEQDIHPDVIRLESIEEEADITISQVRSAIEKFRYQPSLGKNRVLCIDPIDSLNRFSINALLKTLEDVPKNTYCILVCTNIQDTIKTILSRAFKFKLSELKPEEVRQYIEDNKTSFEKFAYGGQMIEDNKIAPEKLAYGRQMLEAPHRRTGAYPSVREDLRSGVTTQLPAEGDFPAAEGDFLIDYTAGCLGRLERLLQCGGDSWYNSNLERIKNLKDPNLEGLISSNLEWQGFKDFILYFLSKIISPLPVYYNEKEKELIEEIQQTVSKSDICRFLDITIRLLGAENKRLSDRKQVLLFIIYGLGNLLRNDSVFLYHYTNLLCK